MRRPERRRLRTESSKRNNHVCIRALDALDTSGSQTFDRDDFRDT